MQISNFIISCTVIPSIEALVHDEVSNQEDSVTFLCQAVGEPVPDISWYFNDVMINVSDNSSKYMIVSRSLNITTTENTITVYDVTSSDVGTYTCNASNIIGSVTSSGILTVTSKFFAIYSSYVCTYIITKHYLINCNVDDRITNAVLQSVQICINLSFILK